MVSYLGRHIQAVSCNWGTGGGCHGCVPPPSWPGEGVLEGADSLPQCPPTGAPSAPLPPPPGGLLVPQGGAWGADPAADEAAAASFCPQLFSVFNIENPIPPLDMMDRFCLKYILMLFIMFRPLFLFSSSETSFF